MVSWWIYAVTMMTLLAQEPDVFPDKRMLAMAFDASLDRNRRQRWPWSVSFDLGLH
jgi:hypothetical protein